MDVIQIPFENQIKPLHNIRTRTFFVLNDGLDEGLLKDGLDRLIREHWRKLGSRIVHRPKDGRLEYHLPLAFDHKHELYRWSSRNDHRSLSEATPSLQALATEKTISILPSISSVDELFRPADWPLERKDEPPNAPLLFVHLTFFADATVVAISCPHVLADQFGLANIVKAWLGVIEGKTPPPMVGHDEDVLAKRPYSDYPKREVVRKGKMRVRRRGEYMFVLLGFMSEFVFHRREESHMVFFPLPLVNFLRARHSKSLEEKYGTSPGLSSGDIISAILLKFSRMHDKKSRVMSLSQSANLRNRVPALSGNPASAFVHNALIFPNARFPINPSTSIGEIAYQNRKNVQEALEQKNIEIDLAVIQETTRRGQAIHTCEPFDRSYSVTNWCAAWRGLDFSAATPRHEAKEQAKSSLFVLGHSNETKTPARFSSVIMCRTDEGFWCSFAASTAAMTLIHEYLEKDPMLEKF
ncbi:hypothetical protein JX265_012000 [Neoarthrinium moseri]|uniref:Uncharacterized protein n=1 Tax=Neoarthrinium moseri TaxID=1658444 RepID=A0A9Q0AH33_9PEZI|nr:hypothetical protein JX265_012000 [Neoarthrinium moseri]